MCQCCVTKEEKKAESFDMFMDMQKKKLKLVEKKIATKAAFEQSKMFMKVADLDAVKYAQDCHATMLKHFTQMEAEIEAFGMGNQTVSLWSR